MSRLSGSVLRFTLDRIRPNGGAEYRAYACHPVNGDVYAGILVVDGQSDGTRIAAFVLDGVEHQKEVASHNGAFAFVRGLFYDDASAERAAYEAIL